MRYQKPPPQKNALVLLARKVDLPMGDMLLPGQHFESSGEIFYHGMPSCSS